MMAILQVIIGGLLSLLGSWLATRQTHKNAVERESGNKCETYRRFMKSILDEIESVFEIYMSGIGKSIEQLPEQHPFLLTGMQGEDYFVVYTSNANLLPLIDDDKLRRSIVNTYAKAKFLKDTIALNNSILEQLYDVYLLKIEKSSDPSSAERIDKLIEGFQTNLLDFSKSLKKIHDEVKVEVEALKGSIISKLNAWNVQ